MKSGPKRGSSSKRALRLTEDQAGPDLMRRTGIVWEAAEARLDRFRSPLSSFQRSSRDLRDHLLPCLKGRRWEGEAGPGRAPAPGSSAEPPLARHPSKSPFGLLQPQKRRHPNDREARAAPRARERRSGKGRPTSANPKASCRPALHNNCLHKWQRKGQLQIQLPVRLLAQSGQDPRHILGQWDLAQGGEGGF